MSSIRCAEMPDHAGEGRPNQLLVAEQFNVRVDTSRSVEEELDTVIAVVGFAKCCADMFHDRWFLCETDVKIFQYFCFRGIGCPLKDSFSFFCALLMVLEWNCP